jgi:diaminohydroxyphosphoribosylaminopyrimidine deaminase/5-amino-6-(5-phosphoribosylamino)uracil reductase
MSEALDRRFMAAAIRLGRSALGTTWPNPAVGAILVKDGSVVGRGRTARGGRPHGEPLALAMAGDEARGATLYVSLEPCAHHGKTPPCADAVVTAGVSRVVAPLEDPNPKVAGTGFQQLRAAGIEVEIGLLADEARRANAGHIKRVTNARPHVTLKLAVSADDAIGRVGEAGTPVTGEVARRHAQALRSRFDAILVGRGTVEADDPQLTCRLPGLSDRSPVRVVLDSDGRLDPQKHIFDSAAPTWMLTADGNAQSAQHDQSLTSPSRGRLSEPAGPEVAELRTLNVPRGEGGLAFQACLERLGREGITCVLVEGGATVARTLLEADLVDEVLLFRSPHRLGGDLVPALAGLPLAAIEQSERFARIDRRRLGDDILSRYERIG